MAINILKVGSFVPDVSFLQLDKIGVKEVQTHKMFAKKLVLVLGVPGPFISDYPASMVMGYDFHAEKFKKIGVDEIFVTSTFDIFVMLAWFKEMNITGLRIMPDPNQTWVEQVGLLVNMRDYNLGDRSHRYAMIVQDNVLKKIFYEDFSHDSRTCFTETNAEKVLDFIRANKSSWLLSAVKN